MTFDGFFEGLRHQAKKLTPKAPRDETPHRKPESTEDILLRQVMKFTQGTQIIVETYRAKTDNPDEKPNIDRSMFNMADYQPGTVFRIAANGELPGSGKNFTAYDWYVIGVADENAQPTVYEINYAKDVEAHFKINQPILKLHPSLHLQRLHPPRTKFGVMVAAKVLSGMDVPDDNSKVGTFDRYFPDERIEIMSSGSLQKASKPKSTATAPAPTPRAGIIPRVLEPQPVKVR